MHNLVMAINPHKEKHMSKQLLIQMKANNIKDQNHQLNHICQ